MSLTTLMNLINEDRFPRVSGDEPGYGHGAIQGEGFSPRERG